MKITQARPLVPWTQGAPASGVIVSDPGGYYGGGPLTLEDVLALIGSGTEPDAFLLKYGGGEGTVQDLGILGTAEIINVQNANKFLGELDDDCTVSFTGWTNGKDAQILIVTTQDGTGGHTVTFSGITWQGGIQPIPNTAPGTRALWAFLSDDGGTIIDGFLIGGGGGATSSDSMVPYYIAPGETFTVPLYKQALFATPITVDGVLDVIGYLIEVD